VVSEVCAGRYGAGRAREERTRSEERAVGRSAARAAVGVEEGVKTGQGVRTTNPISGSKGITIAIVDGCAIAVVTTALLPSTELSITDSCQIDGPIQ